MSGLYYVTRGHLLIKEMHKVSFGVLVTFNSAFQYVCVCVWKFGCLLIKVKLSLVLCEYSVPVNIQ